LQRSQSRQETHSGNSDSDTNPDINPKQTRKYTLLVAKRNNF